MVGGIMKVRVDENEADKLNRVKKHGVVTQVESTKRAALGDLQNRGVFPKAGAKETAKKDAIKENFQNVLRNAKARVDTRLKKPVPTGTIAAKTTVVPAVAAGQRKPLTRSSSVRVPGSSNTLAKNKPKTVTTKVVESKVQQIKYVAKSKVQEKPVTIEPTMRREDSNLSRKSLSKLKAALSRDSGKTCDTKSAATAVGPLQAAKKSLASTETAITKITSTKAASAKAASTKAIAVAVTSQSASKLDELKAALLNEVEDIDAGDGENLVLVSQYARDIYEYLYKLEEKHAIRKNHLEGQLEVSAKMRAVLIDWINEVHLQFHLVPETFQMAVAIIDRYLQAVKDTKRSHLQLVGVTALFLAAKYEELFPPSIADFVYITDDTYTARQILQMELKIFKGVGCNLSRPLPIHFLRRYSKAAKAEDSHHAMSKYFLELTSIEYDMAAYKPSEIAAASLFLSLHLLKDNTSLASGFRDSHWNATLQWYSHYKPEHLRPIAKKIAALVRNASNANLKAVYKKYQASQFHKIAQRPEFHSTLMDSIINSKE